MPSLETLQAALAGRYDVLREVGAGGMATVYLARDVKHDRQVALKVLRPELGAVLGVDRFLSEIKVTANLQHPHLLPLFDSGEAGGLLFYVMPYVEGETLRARLDREQQLPVDEALRIAYAVASALDYAHGAGVIHRDLKPENILLQHGEPVISDFGIALAVSNAGGARITQTGLSLGTPQYMSPEQATGDGGVDARSDIYSLGAVVYEMLVGEAPHAAKTAQAIIARVLTEKVRSIRVFRDTVPPHVDAAVQRALAKLPADRFTTAEKFAAALRSPTSFSDATTGGLLGEAEGAPSRSAPPSPLFRVRSALPWAVTVLAVAAAAAFWTKARDASMEEGTFRYEISLPANGSLWRTEGDPVAVSRGARFLAYVASTDDGGRRLYLRASDDLRPREVAASAGALNPFFSPDGEWIAFWSSGQLKKVPVNGGNPVVITDASSPPVATWSPSGWIVSEGPEGALWKVPAGGGAPAPLTVVDSAAGQTTQASPVALSDGKHVLFTSVGMGGPSNAHIAVASLDDGSSTILGVLGSFALGVLDGNLVYTTADGSVMAAPIDLAKGRVTSAPIALTDQVGVAGSRPLSYAQMSADGALIYVSGVTRRQMVIRGADGVEHPVGEPGPMAWPRLSPDGRHIAVSVGSIARRDVWVYDLPSGPFTRLTTLGDINDRPEWTPDGRSVLFRSSRGDRNGIWKKPIDGSAGATPVYVRTDSRIDEGVLSPDGRYLLFQRDSTGSGEVWYRPIQGDTTPVRVDIDRAGAYGGRFSPDGRWIVYTSGTSGSAEVYARPFPDLSNRTQISASAGTTPVWSPDGKRIYYTSNGQLMAANVGSTRPLTITSRTVVLPHGYTFDAVHADYDVGADGTVVALRSPSQESQLVVVLFLDAELRARIAGSPR